MTVCHFLEMPTLSILKCVCNLCSFNGHEELFSFQLSSFDFEGFDKALILSRGQHLAEEEAAAAASAQVLITFEQYALHFLGVDGAGQDYAE